MATAKATDKNPDPKTSIQGSAQESANAGADAMKKTAEAGADTAKKAADAGAETANRTAEAGAEIVKKTAEASADATRKVAYAGAETFGRAASEGSAVAHKLAETSFESTRKVADVSRTTVETLRTGAEQAQKIAEASTRELSKTLHATARAADEGTRESVAVAGRTIDVALRVGNVVAEGYQSIVSTVAKYAQESVERNTAAYRTLFRLRSPSAFLAHQSNLWRDNTRHLLELSASLSVQSADTARKAAAATEEATSGDRRI